MEQNKDYPVFKGEREAEEHLRESNLSPEQLESQLALAKEMIHSTDMEVQGSGLHLKRAIENEQRSRTAREAMQRHRRRVRLAKYSAAVAVPLLGALIAIKVHRLLNPPRVSRTQELINVAQERAPMAAPLLEKLPDPVAMEKKVRAAMNAVSSATKEAQLPSLGEARKSLGSASEKATHILSGATSTVSSKVGEVSAPRATAPLRELPLLTLAQDAWYGARFKVRGILSR